MFTKQQLLAMKRKTELYQSINASEVRSGDIVYIQGYRCKAAYVTILADRVQFSLQSAPDALHTATLPPVFEGMQSGAMHTSKITIQKRQP